MAENIENVIWKAPEYQYRHKDISWYWLSIIAAALIFLIAIWQKNFLFAVFVIVAEAMLIFWAKESPKIITFVVDKSGVHIGKIKHYSFEDLTGFYLSGENNDWELVLRTKSKTYPYIKILAPHIHVPKIKRLLNRHLEEIEYKESLADHIEKMLGF